MIHSNLVAHNPRLTTLAAYRDAERHEALIPYLE